MSDQNSIINVSTEYSLDRSVISIADIIEKAKSMDASTVIVTEKNTLRSAAEVLTECRRSGIRASVGLRTDFSFQSLIGEITLIPKDFEGFMEIVSLSGKVNLKSENESVYIEIRDLEEFFSPDKKGHGNVIVTTGSLNGLVSRLLQNGQEEMVALLLKRFKMIFGRDNVFAEVQYHGEKSEREIYPRLADIADSLDIPLIATNDPYFTNNTDKDRMRYSIMKFRSEGKYTELSDAEKEHYIKTSDELKAALKAILTEEQCDRAINASVTLDPCSRPSSEYAKLSCRGRAISDAKELERKIDSVDTTPPHHYPKFISDDGTPAPDLLRKRVYDRIPSLADVWNEVYEKRLCKELNVITELGFCDYMLIVADIVRFAKAEAKRICKYNCLPVGPGRGSAVGSLVCYLLGITNIDPVAHGLMFERFLNRARKTMPDIDIDLAPFIRERALQYLRDKYGANAVCGIIEPVRYKAKEAISLAAKFTTAQTGDKDYLAVGEAVSKACKSGSRLTDNVSELSSFDSDDKAKRIIDIAKLCDGIVKTLSKHPCGIVIGDTGKLPVPTSRSALSDAKMSCRGDKVIDTKKVGREIGSSVTLADCDKSYIESFYGLLKIDLLSLRTLDAVSNMLANIEKNEKTKINFSEIPEEKEVFSSVFWGGNTDFIFQFGSDGMKDWLRKLHPRNIDELTMLAAAFRPGPMQFLPVIKDVMYGEKQPELISQKLRPILNETCGCIIYQEQLLRIFTDIAGFSPADADRIRAAVCHKNREEIEAVKESFISGCCHCGLSEEESERLFDQIVSFGSYAFNKSHAAAYAVLAYRMAWLFYHYPAYFLASSFRYSEDNDAVLILYRECSRCEVEILPPDVNISGYDITAKGDTVRIGFSMVDGCKAIGKSIAADRRKNSGYESLSDFLLRIRPDERALKNLALSGALDCFKVSRGSVVHNIDDIMKQTAELADLTRQIEKTDDTVTENSIKDKIDLCRKRITSLSEGPETMPLNMIVKAEQEMMGIPLSFSKLHECDSSGAARRTTCIKGMQIGKHRICGMIWECHERKRKKDKARFLSVLFSDGTGFIECVLPTHRYAKYEALFSEGNYLCLEGECTLDSINENKNVFWIDAASLLEPINVSYYLRFSDYTEWMNAQKEIGKFTDYPMANLYISISDGEWTLYPRKVSPEIVKSFPMIEPGESR